MKGTRLFWQSILVVAFAAVATLFAAQSGDALKPQGDFKHWYLVHSTLITKSDNKLGLIAGVHLIYVNAAGFDRLKRGGSRPYPDGTMFSDDVRDYSAEDGVYVQGATRKAITLMVKDSKKYASTGGLGVPGVGWRRSHEANRHRLGETMLQLPCAPEGAGLHVLEVS
ncbi:MAG TPA: cytochrome P460 family protein [Vicinamibacterales bacterium]|nr:cytochrome P460 family protein [Vicinamibacterales bacterium]